LRWWIRRYAGPKGHFERSIRAFELSMIRARHSYHARINGGSPARRRVAVAVLKNWLGHLVFGLLIDGTAATSEQGAFRLGAGNHAP
jgi:hypothetical protein